MAIINTIVEIAVESVASLYKYGGRVDALLQQNKSRLCGICMYIISMTVNLRRQWQNICLFAKMVQWSNLIHFSFVLLFLIYNPESEKAGTLFKAKINQNSIVCQSLFSFNQLKTAQGQCMSCFMFQLCS